MDIRRNSEGHAGQHRSNGFIEHAKDVETLEIGFRNVSQDLVSDEVCFDTRGRCGLICERGECG